MCLEKIPSKATQALFAQLPNKEMLFFCSLVAVADFWGRLQGANLEQLRTTLEKGSQSALQSVGVDLWRPFWASSQTALSPLWSPQRRKTLQGYPAYHPQEFIRPLSRRSSMSM